VAGARVRLLLDHNLSPRLVDRLADLYPGATHVAAVGLERATDAEVWAYGGAHGCVIVTKDSDFIDLAVLRGPVPKVVWLRLGNCTTADIERVLRRARDAIEDFVADTTAGVLELL
jgi:predicted nuclease of predicted toxin-antitoxin system